MRLRKQAPSASALGDEFLRAVSSGQELPRPPVTPATDAADLKQQLLESERRAVSAEEALRQIREESDERLEEVRGALERERASRIAAEHAYERSEGESRAAQPHTPSGDPEAAPDGLFGDSAADADDEADFTFGGRHPRAQTEHDGEVIAGTDDDAPWPTPWLTPEKRGR